MKNSQQTKQTFKLESCDVLSQCLTIAYRQRKLKTADLHSHRFVGQKCPRSAFSGFHHLFFKVRDQRGLGW